MSTRDSIHGKGMYTILAKTKMNLIQNHRIRYAAPPTGLLRWQSPQAPAVNRGQVLSAASLPQRCPQSPNSPMLVNYLWTCHRYWRGHRPAGFNFTGNEDCLFLSVYAPANATSLPGTYSFGNITGVKDICRNCLRLWLNWWLIHRFGEAMLMPNISVSADMDPWRWLWRGTGKCRFECYH